jgi:uncharacterized protein (DUF1684 family)
MKYLKRTILLFLLIIGVLFSIQLRNTDNNEEYTAEITKWQQQLNHEFADSIESPLTPEDRARFSALDFYPINQAYQVDARFERTLDESEFGMKTTTERRPIYVRYGIAYFTLNGKDFKINIYQNVKFAKTDKYKDYLFMLFTDLSSGNETYAGGRYIDLRIPKTNSIIIDFNKAYNPYCAYNHHYSCPIPPEEDFFDIEILAGCKKGFH